MHATPPALSQQLLQLVQHQLAHLATTPADEPLPKASVDVLGKLHRMYRAEANAEQQAQAAKAEADVAPVPNSAKSVPKPVRQAAEALPVASAHVPPKHIELDAMQEADPDIGRKIVAAADFAIVAEDVLWTKLQSMMGMEPLPQAADAGDAEGANPPPG